MFFFFKQKTAYELRISDWSSDGCSSDLLAGVLPWPRLPLEELPVMTRWVLMDAAEDVHHILVYLLLLAVPLHVVAALKHHFWDHHDVLRGMLPEIPDADDPRAGLRHRRRPGQFPKGSAADR